MADLFTFSLPTDPSRIQVHSIVEVNYWCQFLSCTQSQLRNALIAVGPLSANVRAYLTATVSDIESSRCSQFA
jgi:hypothetical protein